MRKAVVFALLLGTTAAPFGAAALGALPEAHARETVKVGDVLQALEDVELDEAVIARGSKVSIAKRTTAGGATFLDVALADGHVVRGVPIAVIAKSFRVLDE